MHAGRNEFQYFHCVYESKNNSIHCILKSESARLVWILIVLYLDYLPSYTPKLALSFSAIESCVWVILER